MLKYDRCKPPGGVDWRYAHCVRCSRAARRCAAAVAACGWRREPLPAGKQGAQGQQQGGQQGWGALRQCFRRGARSRRRGRPVWAAGYTPYEFDEKDYRRVNLQLIIQNSATTESLSGTLILMEERGNPGSEEDAKCLLLQVGGDTLLGISYLAQGKEPQRPMTLNLLFNVLDELKQRPSEPGWHLLHVAIVDLKDNTFIGRLFFGCPVAGKVEWDCDCRPSDGCWLALKNMCPLYVHNSVWDECAQPLKAVFNVEQTRGLLEHSSQFSAVEGKKADEEDPFTSIRDDDPVVIKRLKRQMAVAVSEEDYSTAAKIRDHPYMTKYREIDEHRRAGRFSEATELQDALEKEMQENDNMI